MTEAEQIKRLREALYAIVNALGAALPMTPEVVRTMNAVVESDIESVST